MLILLFFHHKTEICNVLRCTSSKDKSCAKLRNIFELYANNADIFCRQILSALFSIDYFVYAGNPFPGAIY